MSALVMVLRYDPLRADERYPRLVGRMNLP
jgi:hypothetical protein